MAIRMRRVNRDEAMLYQDDLLDRLEVVVRRCPMTQTQLAKEIGMSRASLIRFLSGQGIISSKTRFLIEKYIDQMSRTH